MLTKLAALVERSGRGGPRFDDGRSAEHPLGFLSREDAVAIVRDWLLPVAVVAEYIAMLASDFVHAPRCSDPSDVGFTAETARSLTADERLVCERTAVQLRAVLQHVPADHPLHRDSNSWVELVRRHVGTCDSCSAQVERLGIFVKIEIGGVKLSREYGLLSGRDWR